MLRRVSLVSVRSINTSARLCKDEDLITNAFLKQIRDLAAKQKAAGSLVNTSPEIKKQLDEQLNRLAQKFKLASAEVVSHLPTDFEKANVDNSVSPLTDGQTLDEMIAHAKASQAEYEKERDARKREEAQKQAMLSQGTDEKAATAGWLPNMPERDEYLKKYRHHH
ncbi:mitochondrial ATP synthase coupling factor 6 domain-containing protein [Ditylenchus destructor]|uniref:Mitochondrial ATP synthase coupling factor 6 domain-containing protein n=1 Tax=Ditylenchus destructor TaxID=166010 RepID=A0AAD4N964_9BILA|nr:mitochondrial ATP synthase coupling factor 6 domain-containing protein [Ditylenchus destructor]